MNTRQSRVIRLTASALLAVVVTIGAHSFVPTAFGCGQMGGGNCKKAAPTQTSPADGFLSQVRLLIGVLDLYV